MSETPQIGDLLKYDGGSFDKIFHYVVVDIRCDNIWVVDLFSIEDNILTKNVPLQSILYHKWSKVS